MKYPAEDAKEPDFVNESALSSAVPISGPRWVTLNTDEGDKTIEYIESLPDGVRKELIDGKVYDMATPTITHQEILIELAFDIKGYIRSKEGKCKVLPAPHAVLLFADGKNWFEPDISVVCDLSKLDNKGCHGAPDWVIEIVSPSSSKKDHQLKSDKYQLAGVKEYWIIDHDKATVDVYDFENGAVDPDTYTLSEIIASHVIEGYVANFADLMGRIGKY